MKRVILVGLMVVGAAFGAKASAPTHGAAGKPSSASTVHSAGRPVVGADKSASVERGPDKYTEEDERIDEANEKDLERSLKQLYEFTKGGTGITGESSR